jgi:hypothetical protein
LPFSSGGQRQGVGHLPGGGGGGKGNCGRGLEKFQFP